MKLDIAKKKTLCEWTNHLHRVFLLLIENFSAFAGRAAATEGSDLGSLYSLTLTYPCFIYSFTDYAAKLKYFVTENPSDFLLSKAMNILL